MQHPEYFVVSANIVNQPLLSWVHWNLGAIKPYLPELDNNGKSERILIDDWEKYDWRVSGLPPWSGPDKFKIEKWKSSEMHHRWLPVPGVDHHILDRTPIERTEYDAMGRGWLEWTIGAQEHYSLFENLENNNMSKYKFDNWDFQYRRMGIQFIAMMGKDINAAKPIGRDDEQHFSCTMPQKLGRRKSSSHLGHHALTVPQMRLQMVEALLPTTVLEAKKAAWTGLIFLIDIGPSQETTSAHHP